MATGVREGWIGFGKVGEEGILERFGREGLHEHIRKQDVFMKLYQEH